MPKNMRKDTGNIFRAFGEGKRKGRTKTISQLKIPIYGLLVVLLPVFVCLVAVLVEVVKG